MAETILPALLIFCLRLVDVTLYTLRFMMTIRGRKRFAWLLGFFQAIVFVTAVRGVIADTGNWLKVVGYAAGFATGMLIGLWIEGRLALGHTHLRIVSARLGARIAESLRQRGFAVTEIPARGRDGAVTLLNVDILRKDTRGTLEIVEQADPDAFITAESVRSVQRGFWNG